jgi:hypothetical protein
VSVVRFRPWAPHFNEFSSLAAWFAKNAKPTSKNPAFPPFNDSGIWRTFFRQALSDA